MNEEYSIVDALVELRPEAQWSIDGRDYTRLVWDSTDTEKGINVGVNTTPPTLDELNTKLTAMNTAEPMRLLRVERDKRIAKSDWRGTKANETGISMSPEWKTYRQSLRDLPSSANPALGDDGGLDASSVTWPTPPS